MGKAKPFLFGALLGASIMFISLQYHVVRSHDGIQLVPRTPQHSLGLAWADIRQWSPTQWTDRSELARALMAHGAGELISQSVAESLTDTVSSERATLDQLKLFMNKAQQNDDSQSQGLFRLPDLLPQETAEPAASGTGSAIPFPRSAAAAPSAESSPAAVRAELPDPFRTARSSDQPAASRFSAGDLLDDPLKSLQESAVAAAAPPAARNSAGSPTAAAPRSSPTNTPAAVAPPVAGPSAPQTAEPPVFGDVTADLESRARSALSRAQSTLSEQAGQQLQQGSEAASTYLRERVGDTRPPLGAGGTSSSPPAVAPPAAGATTSGNRAAEPGRAQQDTFDPFFD